jgi:hypothetical protein
MKCYVAQYIGTATDGTLDMQLAAQGGALEACCHVARISKVIYLMLLLPLFLVLSDMRPC